MLRSICIGGFFAVSCIDETGLQQRQEEGTDEVVEDTATIGAPSTPTVTIAPSAPLTGDPLQAIVTTPAVDPQGLPFTYRYRWSVGGVERPDVVGDTVLASLTAHGQKWSVAVTAVNEAAESPAAMAEVQVGNSVPTAPTVELSPREPGGADDLVCTASGSVDADEEELTYQFSWTRNGAPYTGAATEGGRSTVAASETHDGETFACSVSASDGTATSAPVTASTAAVKACTALRFSSSTAWAELANPPSLADLAAFTLEMWVWGDRWEAFRSALMARRPSGTTGTGYLLAVIGKDGANTAQQGRVLYQLSGGSDPMLISTSPVPTGRWAHVALTWSQVSAGSGTATIWIDGVSSGTSTIKAPAATAAAQVLLLGADSASHTYNLEGALDEVRISASVRYTQNFAPPRRHVRDDVTLLLWHFDEGRDGVEPSDSDHAASLTLHEATWSSASTCDP